MGQIAAGFEASTSKAAITYVDMDTFDVTQGPSFSVREIADEVGQLDVGQKGYLTTDVPGEMLVPGTVFVHGIDMVMREGRRDLAVAAATVQGHILHFLSRQGLDTAINLPSIIPLYQQFGEGGFTGHGPMWMDDSTEAQVATFNEMMAGLDVIKVAPRYPGLQIFKRLGTDMYRNAALIAVGCGLTDMIMTGKRAFAGPCDAAASGLVNLETLAFDEVAIARLDSGLRAKLAPAVTGAGTLLGDVQPYWRNLGYDRLQWAYSDQDNAFSVFPASGFDNVFVVSSGSSRSGGRLTASPIPGFQGNFASGDGEKPYMPLITCKNSDCVQAWLLREYEKAPNDFDAITEALEVTPPGNNGRMAIFYVTTEISPHAPNVPPEGFYKRKGYGAGDFNADVRAFYEQAAYSMFIQHRDRVEPHAGPVRHLFFAGGLANQDLGQKIYRDMFGVPSIESPDPALAAMIGAALVAIAAYRRQPLGEVVQAYYRAHPPRITSFDKAAHVMYMRNLSAYEAFERECLRQVGPRV